MTENQNSVSDDITMDTLEQGFAFSLPTTEEAPKHEVEDDAIIDLTQSEENQEESTPEPKEEPIVPSILNQEPAVYKSLVQKYIQNGTWEDVLIKEGDTEVKLSELEDVSEEEFLKLVEDQKAIKDEDLKEKYIPVEGLSEEKKIIVDILRNGGDLKEIFKTEQALVKPFDESLGWDLDREEHQASIVYQQYLAQGNSEKQARILVEEDRKDLVLDSKAKDIAEKHQKVYFDNLQKINADLVESKKAEQEEIKKFRSEITKSYKDQKLPESQIKKLVDLATRETEDGFAVDSIYEEKMKDPKEAQELIFFLADKEKYLQQKMLETKVQTNVSNMRVIKRIPLDRDKKVKEESSESVTGYTFSLP